MRLLYTCAILLSSLLGMSQNHSFVFNGNNSYLDLGNSAGNGVRTVELWIQPNQLINPQLNEYSITLFRNSENCGNCHEFGFFFNPNYAQNSGHLGFKVHDANNVKHEVLSDTNFWQIGRWYHLAAVIHPQSGLSLYINGVKQNSVAPGLTSPTVSSNRITTVGCQGDRFDRNFNGRIDEVRLSSTARYTQNFNPNCTHPIDSNTVAYYPMDLISNGQTFDLGPNAYHASVNMISQSSLNACSAVGLSKESQQSQLKVFPNPFKNELLISNPLQKDFQLQLRNVVGQSIAIESIREKNQRIETADLKAGIYFISIYEKGELVEIRKLIKQ